MSDAVLAFRQASRTVLSCWTALNLAVENSWGGENSQNKREELINSITDFCLSKKQLYSDEVEDLLYDRIQSLFFVDIEDGSEVEIAKLLVQLHSSCSNGDTSFAHELSQKLRKCDSSQCHGKENVVEASSDDENSMNEGMSEDEIDTKDNNQTTKGRKPKTEELDDGWTKVL